MTETTDDDLVEGMYQKMWKDFVSLQRGDVRLICEDAARYRWLKANHLQTGTDSWIRTGDDLEEVIDAEMNTPKVEYTPITKEEGNERT